MEHQHDHVSLLSPTRKKTLFQRVTLNRRLKYILVASLVGFLLIIAIAVPVGITISKKEEHNIIFIIADGFGPACIAYARELSGRNLTWDRPNFIRGTVRTYSSSSYITDSAAGATAYSCALKTYNGAVGVDPSKKPCGTLMEAAKEYGKEIGIVVTSRITHATPASFSSHVINRDFEETIAVQQLNLKPNLMFGGGLRMFNKRADKKDLVEEAQKLGYQFITSKEEFDGKTKLPIIGLFANGHMDYEIDRNPNQQPSLKEMVEKALNLLHESSKDKKGFFLLIEASRIDMVCISLHFKKGKAEHLNDAAAMYGEVIAYDDAMQVVLDFAKKNKNTLVVASSDHETGGFAIGRNFPNNTAFYGWYPNVIKAVSASAEKMAGIINTGQNVSAILSQYAGFFPTPVELAFIANYTPPVNSSSYTSLSTAIGNVIAQRALLGFTTVGHTGVDVNLYSTGIYSEELSGNYENIAIGKWVADVIGLDLKKATASVSNVNPNEDSLSKRGIQEPEQKEYLVHN